MNNKKNILMICLCIAIFGFVGIYLTFIAGNTDKYDSQTRAYQINPNSSYDSEDGTMYYPIYYFKANGREYECKSKLGSSSYPNDKKNIVYYDSANPKNCKIEYDKSSNKLFGIICLIATAFLVFFGLIKKSPSSSDEYHQERYIESNHFDQEKVDNFIAIIGKAQLIYKRIILGIIIVILLVLTLFDTMLFKQTIKARNYIDTVATYKDKKSTDDDLFEDHIFIFTAKDGKQYEVVKSYPKDGSITPQTEIKVKYNEKNPKDYYEEGSTLDKTGMTWYIVKVVALVLLIALFFNKRLLNRINISAGRN